MPPSKRDIFAALDRLAAAEEKFRKEDFLAPVAQGTEVQVRIAGIVCRLRVEPAEFSGWGVFRAVSPSVARLQRLARLAERQRYLELFPQIRLVVLTMIDGRCLAINAHQGDRRFRLMGPVPIMLAEEVQMFDTVNSRFDGTQFWFEGLNALRDPGIAAYLRESLPRMVAPAALARPGISAEERLAYATHYRLKLAEQQAAEVALREALRDRTEERLRDALAHAGADLADYRELADSYQVRYYVDGHQHMSVVGKRDLTVQSAGICLSDEDAHFDLASLVGVLREYHDA